MKINESRHDLGTFPPTRAHMFGWVCVCVLDSMELYKARFALIAI